MSFVRKTSGDCWISFFRLGRGLFSFLFSALIKKKLTYLYFNSPKGFISCHFQHHFLSEKLCGTSFSATISTLCFVVKIRSTLSALKTDATYCLSHVLHFRMLDQRIFPLSLQRTKTIIHTPICQHGGFNVRLTYSMSIVVWEGENVRC